MVSLISALLLAGSEAVGTLSGTWESPLGDLTLKQTEDRVVGTGASSCHSGSVLEGDLLDDSLSGRIYLCLKDCAQGPGWVPVLLLISPDGASAAGMSTLPKGCPSPVGRNGSLVLRRAPAGAVVAAAVTRTAPSAQAALPPLPDAPPPAPSPSHPVRATRPAPTASAGETATAPATPPPSLPPTPPGPSTAPAKVSVAPPLPAEDPAARERAIAIATEGAALQQEGRFEQARTKFIQSTKIDPRYAEGFNGVGVTFFARNDLHAALEWYKRALRADPAFGDAYYNMACVYAVQKRRPLALRYLQTAFRNHYTSREAMRVDPDLASLRGDAAFKALLAEGE